MLRLQQGTFKYDAQLCHPRQLMHPHQALFSVHGVPLWQLWQLWHLWQLSPVAPMST